MDSNINFRGRLVIDGMTTNKARWKNIAKMFKDETRGINYESRIFDDTNVIEIYTDRLPNKNRKYDFIDEFTSRDAILTNEGSEELLSQPDSVIAKILSKHLQFVKKLDDSCKQADKALNEAFSSVLKAFQKNDINRNYVDDMFENLPTADEIGQIKVLPEYNELKELAGFKDAKLSHISHIE